MECIVLNNGLNGWPIHLDNLAVYQTLEQSWKIVQTKIHQFIPKAAGALTLMLIHSIFYKGFVLTLKGVHYVLTK